MCDIEPLAEGVRGEWGSKVSGVSIFISGSKTDWLNEWATRSHSAAGAESPDKHLRLVSAMVGIHEVYPAKFATKTNTPPLPAGGTGRPYPRRT